MTRPDAPSPRRVCPACARRAAGQIDPDCIICGGYGVLNLGANGLSQYPSAVVSLAVEYRLETVGRLAVANSRDTAGLLRGRRALQAAVSRMQDVGILARMPHTALPAKPKPGSWSVIHKGAKRLDPGYRPDDGAALQTPPLPMVFEFDEQPNAHGWLPNFSFAGYLCHLSRLSDPLDPMLWTTAEVQRNHERTQAGARTLAGGLRELDRNRPTLF